MLISAVREDLCLGFANTLTWRGSGTPTEKLRDLADLLGWIERSAGVGATAAQRIRAWAREHPRKAAHVFAEAIAIREAIYRVFAALADGGPVRDQDFAALRQAIAEAPARRELARADASYAWRIDLLQPTASDLLASVLWSAGDLVLNARNRRIRRCANEKCLWLFVDESKSGTRRWCDMTSCGNRAKAHRHYSKVRQD